MSEQQQASPQIDQIITGVLNLRDQIDLLDAQHKATTKPLKEAVEALEIQLLQICNSTGQTQLGCESGIAFLKTQSFVSMNEWDEFIQWAIANGRIDMLKKDVSKNAVAEFVDATGNPPPGIKWDTKRVIQIRRK